MPVIKADFTGVHDVPAGELYIQIVKSEFKESKGGQNPMIVSQCKILQDESGRWVGRQFIWQALLATDMKRDTFDALTALGIGFPEGQVDIDTDVLCEELVGKTCWVFAVAQEPANDQYQKSTMVKRWGITPTATGHKVTSL